VAGTRGTLYGSDVQVGSLPACPSPVSSDGTSAVTTGTDSPLAEMGRAKCRPAFILVRGF